MSILLYESLSTEYDLGKLHQINKVYSFNFIRKIKFGTDY